MANQQVRGLIYGLPVTVELGVQLVRLLAGMEFVLSEDYGDEPTGTAVDLSWESVILERVGIARTSRASGTILKYAKRRRQSVGETRAPADRPAEPGQTGQFAFGDDGLHRPMNIPTPPG